MSATSQAGKKAIARAGNLEGAIDESCHRIVFFRKTGHKKLESLEQKTLAWLRAEQEKRTK